MSAAMFTHWGRSMLDDRLDLWVQGSDGRAIERTDLPIIDLRASPRSGEIAGTGGFFALFEAGNLPEPEDAHG